MNSFHLKNAPIKEALIDFRFTIDENFNIDQFKRLESDLKSDFPSCEDSWEFTGQFNFNPKGTKMSNDQVLNGKIFKNSDSTEIIQFRKNGFTYNKLKPYEDWSTFTNKAKKYWGLYKKIITPTFIQRSAVRYINELPLESDLVDFSFLRKKPVIDETVGSSVKEYFSRTTIEVSKNHNIANISQLLKKNSDKSGSIYLLDIDVFNEKDFFGPDDEGLWKKLDEFRDMKNEIFKNTLSDNKLKEFV